MSNAPKPGDPISMEDVEMIIEAIGKRIQNFPDEPPALAFALVMKNIGDRFTPVECLEKEWTGIKFDVHKPEEGDPKCPNGHPLMQGKELTLGWVEGV